MAPGRDPVVRVPFAALLRQPLLLATAAVFVGCVVGLLGTFRQAALEVSYNSTFSAMLFAAAAQAAGEALAALSLLGVPALLGSRTAGRRAAYAGGVLLLLLVAASAASVFSLWYENTGDRIHDTTAQPPLLWDVAFWTTLFLPAAVVVPFILAALMCRSWRLGALLAGLCVLAFPFGVVQFFLSPPDASYQPSAAPWLLGLLGTGVSLPEAALYGMLGTMFFREARERAYGKAERLEAEENRKKARRLYEDGLGRGDLSVVDELASENFRDLRHGGRGRLGMERILRDLWESFPDFTVEVMRQEAKGDLVRTSLLLCGTGRGRGVLFRPPTGRPATFSAEFVDRFSRGKLVEHDGSTDTEGLLRQLDHPQEDGL